METVILASRSPRRRKLLRQIGLRFEVCPSDASEEYEPGQKADDIVQHLALRKAEEVALQSEKALVIGADTLVVLDGNILGKPEGEREAVSMLESLSGRSHQVYTGVALVRGGGGSIRARRTFYENTTVHFAPLKEREIEAYVASGAPMDKAGGYGIQDDLGALFVEAIEGDYNNVVGFPLQAFYRHLEHFAPELAVGIFRNVNG